MILDDAAQRLGQRVAYPAGQLAAGSRREEGTIIRVTDRYVFVLYDGDNMPKATYADDLELLA